MAELMVDVLENNRGLQRLELHEFVVMPNHLHLLITPGPEISLEKCMQYVKGGFSYRAKREVGFQGEVWQVGFNEHRIVDSSDYYEHAAYIGSNPVRAALAQQVGEFRWSSASGRWEMDPVPAQFRVEPAVRG